MSFTTLQKKALLNMDLGVSGPYIQGQSIDIAAISQKIHLLGAYPQGRTSDQSEGKELFGDIKFFYEENEPATIKLETQSYKVVRDPGFETAVTISLFTEARANVEDVLPSSDTTLRGWWGDELLDVPIGSRRWLLERTKINGNNLKLLEQYEREALEWMVQDGIVDRIEIVATRDLTDPTGQPRPNKNRVKITGKVVKVDNSNVFFEYFLNWKAQIGAT